MIPCFLLGSLVAYFLVTIIYRVHIHPLSKFPGPRLAALTGLYEIYFAAWGTGSFEDEIDRMHEEYGPVVRITPDEVHVQDQFSNAQHADSWIKDQETIDVASTIDPSSGGASNHQRAFSEAPAPSAPGLQLAASIISVDSKSFWGFR